MTARTKLAVFFILISLIFTTLKVQSAKNSALVNLKVEIKEAVSVGAEGDKLKVQSNSPTAFFVLVYDEITKSTAYLPADSQPVLETGKTYTIIPAP